MIDFIWNDEKKYPISIGAGKLLSLFFMKFAKETTNSRKVSWKSSKETFNSCGNWIQTGNQIFCNKNSSYQAVYERDSDLHELLSIHCAYTFIRWCWIFFHIWFARSLLVFFFTYVQIQMMNFSLKRSFLELKRAFSWFSLGIKCTPRIVRIFFYFDFDFTVWAKDKFLNCVVERSALKHWTSEYG